MAEPNPITADGLFGIFLGHTFIVTESGHEVVDDFPLKIAVAGEERLVPFPRRAQRAWEENSAPADRRNGFIVRT
jgi:hypothetical protein